MIRALFCLALLTSAATAAVAGWWLHQGGRGDFPWDDSYQCTFEAAA